MNSAEVKSQIAELESLRASTKRWRTGLILAIILIVGGSVFMLIDSALELTRGGPEQQQFVDELTKGLKEDVVPSLEKIGRKTFAESKPIIEKELKKLNDRAPEFAAAVAKEGELLTHNLPVKGEKAINASFGAMLKKRESKIREMFPEATETKVSELVANLTEAGHDRINEAADKIFTPHIDAIRKISDNLESIKKSEKVDLNDDLPTWEMALLVMDIMHDDFKDVAVTDEPAAAKKAPAKKEAK